MGADYNYYWDFSKETNFSWKLLSRKEGRFHFQAEFTLEEEGNYVLFQKLPSGNRFQFEEILLDGEKLSSRDGESVSYVAPYFSRRGYRKFLVRGKHLIEIRFSAPLVEDPEKEVPGLFFSLDKDMEKAAVHDGNVFLTIPLPEKEEYKENLTPLFSPEEEKEFLPALSAGNSPIPGRFGFSKGDGVLDCAMPCLGMVDKLYLCGHPEYRKNFRWSYYLLPEGAPLHGSYPPAEKGLEEDDIQVDQIHVKWSSSFDGIKYSNSYSLASPGILTERNDAKMRISGLEFAGNYQYALLPLPGGKEAKVLPIKELPEHLSDMGRNFILLFGSSEFPDLPLLLVFSKRPRNMKINYSAITGRLSSITMENCPLLFTATPCGMESPAPISPLNTEFLEDLLARCSFWSRAVLAYPVKCREYFRDDPENESVTILQKFEYRIIEDEWGTIPLRLAPIPPAATLTDDEILPGEIDFKFPTKYGYFRGSIGSESSYTIPYMPTYRLFPLKEKNSSIPALMEKGMKEYIAFQEQFSPSFLAYPYAGAVLEPYAYMLSMLAFCEKASREKIRKKVAERLPWAFRKDKAFDYTAIVHAYMMKTMPEDEELLKIYQDPALKHYHLQNWFERRDPFTGASYHICYLNVGLFSSGVLKTGSQEEINSLQTPFVENDWGAGLTYYYLYMSALATGNFDIIRENMPLLKSAAKFFEVLHDWACMGTGYSDNAILWVEGANYGFFTSYINLAEASGDRETLARARYLGAKQYALRRTTCRYAAHYLYKFYNVPPWYGVRFLFEDSCASWQFQNYQGDKRTLYKKRFRREAIYNMTTEGLYPEFFRGLRLGNDLDAESYFRPAREQLHSGELDGNKNWEAMQMASSILIDLALQEDVSGKQLKKELEFIREKGLLMQKWRGIHIASRRLPENYFESQLLAWDAMKEHPIHLENWVDLFWEEATWDPEEKMAAISIKITGKSPRIRFGLRNGNTGIKSLLFNGVSLPLPEIRKGRYGRSMMLPLPEGMKSGELLIKFM